MSNQELDRQLQRLTGLFNRTAQAAGGDIEIQAHWAKYLCVLSAGFIENAISELYAAYVKQAASPPVADYAIQSLERIQNPKAEKFVEVARAFKREWAEELDMYVKQDGRKEAIDSIMNNRHRIAHGQNSGVTVAQLRDWLAKSVDVIDFVERQTRS